MVFNKTKALETALKSLNQGKLGQAISEYQQILRFDPKDPATLMTLGDLFVRQGDLHKATEYFEKLAQAYLQDGFNSKAIAIYKKISKLAPAETRPIERLADLYIQQGVLSEARPLFLQLAEIYLKSDQKDRAADMLRRLLEVEPENARVQMRLAELYQAMGQKAQASQTYVNFARRLFERNEFSDARRFAQKALDLEPANPAAAALQAQALAGQGHGDQAIAVLEALPDAGAGGEVTSLLIDLALRGGKTSRALELARAVFARSPQHHLLASKVASTLLDDGQPDLAFRLIAEIRGAMIEANEGERLGIALLRLSEKLPGRLEPLEWLVDLYRRTSDPFHLPEAMWKLGQAAAAADQPQRAEQLFRELLERDPGNEKLLQALGQLKSNGGAVPAAQAPATNYVAPQPLAAAESSATPAIAAGPALDDETQRYIAQALTDVDLFSSYGLSQKAMQLLENVLLRVPQHTATLERLLDLCLGAGDAQRIAEVAAQLVQIYQQRGDSIAAERYSELHRRFARAATHPQATTATLSQDAASEFPPSSAELTQPDFEDQSLSLLQPADNLSFEVGSVLEPAHQDSVSPATRTSEIPEFAIESADLGSAPKLASEKGPADEPEIDLSEEWMALSAELGATPPELSEGVAAAPPPDTPSKEAFQAAEAVAAHTIENPKSAAEELPIVTGEIAAPQQSEPQVLELELVSARPAESQHSAASLGMTAEDFLQQLGSEVEGFEPLAPISASVASSPVLQATSPPLRRISNPDGPLAVPPPGGPAIARPSGNGKDLDQLSEVFQEFRAELDEIDSSGEDLETHYNLGIAYREMGLLDEAIGEFQKVAKAVQSGKPFRYAMQCSTLLGLTFMAKAEPKIAALWYLRALDTPDLDQESILALRYDLGVAQELAGDAGAALESFQQVYAMNIDYRDVADRIAALQKH